MGLLCPSDTVRDNAMDIRVVVNRESLMSRPKEEKGISTDRSTELRPRDRRARHRRYLRGWRRLWDPAPHRDPQLLMVELELPAALLMTEKFARAS